MLLPRERVTFTTAHCVARCHALDEASEVCDRAFLDPQLAGNELLAGRGHEGEEDGVVSLGVRVDVDVDDVRGRRSVVVSPAKRNALEHVAVM